MFINISCSELVLIFVIIVPIIFCVKFSVFKITFVITLVVPCFKFSGFKITFFITLVFSFAYTVITRRRKGDDA